MVFLLLGQCFWLFWPKVFEILLVRIYSFCVRIGCFCVISCRGGPMLLLLLLWLIVGKCLFFVPASMSSVISGRLILCFAASFPISHVVRTFCFVGIVLSCRDIIDDIVCCNVRTHR